MGREKGGKNRKWTVEQKLRIIDRHLKEHLSMRQIAREEQISCGMLSNWVNSYIEGGIAALAKRPGNPYAAVQNKHLSEEERLRLIIKSIPGVRVSTMFRVKGMEFDGMYVVSANKDMLPFKAKLNAVKGDKIEETNLLKHEANLLSVAVTRARKVAWVSYYGEPSCLLQNIDEE